MTIFQFLMWLFNRLFSDMPQASEIICVIDVEVKLVFKPVPVTYIPQMLFKRSEEQNKVEKLRRDFIAWRDNNRLLFG